MLECLVAWSGSEGILTICMCPEQMQQSKTARDGGQCCHGRSAVEYAGLRVYL